MELFDIFLQAVASNAIWDAIKGGVHVTGKWLKERLADQKFPTELTQSQLDALASELQGAPSYAKSDLSALQEYLKSHHIRPIIEKTLQQQSNKISISGNNSGVVVGGNVEGGIINR